MDRQTYHVQFSAAVVHGHVPTVPRVVFVGKQLVHVVPEGEAAVPQHALLAVLAKYDVALLEGRGGPDAHGLLAGRHHVEADAALALGVEHDGVHDGHGHHVAVQAQHLVVAQVLLKVRVDHDAVLVHDAVGGHRRRLGRVREPEPGRELALERAGERHEGRVGLLREAADLSPRREHGAAVAGLPSSAEAGQGAAAGRAGETGLHGWL